MSIFDRMFTWNQWIERNLYWFIPLALVGGFFFFQGLANWIHLVPYLFAWITFAMALGCRSSDVWAALQKPYFMLALFVVGHLILGLIGWVWGSMWLGGGSPFIAGLVLLAAIPFGISSIIWVDQAKGHRAFTLALVVIDTVLSPLTMPAMLSVLLGQHVDVPVGLLMRDLFWMLVVPTIVGIFVNEISNGRAQQRTKKWLGFSTKISFVLVVMINAAAVAPQIWPFRAEIPLLLPCIVGFVLIGYALGWWIGKGQPAPFRKAGLFIGGMRNISLGLVVALPYFGATVAFPVILTILLQQPLATVMHRLLSRVDFRS